MKKIKVKVNIKPGPASEAQKRAWARFWDRVVARANKESEPDNTGRR